MKSLHGRDGIEFAVDSKNWSQVEMQKRNSEYQESWLTLEYQLYDLVSRTSLGMLKNPLHFLMRNNLH
jgi:hypothetical protein